MSHKENCDKVDKVDIQMETKPEKAASFVGPQVPSWSYLTRYPFKL